MICVYIYMHIFMGIVLFASPNGFPDDDGDDGHDDDDEQTVTRASTPKP